MTKNFELLYRLMISEQQHTINRRARGEIDIAEYREINEHLSTEIKRLTCLYRGREWPQRSEETK